MAAGSTKAGNTAKGEGGENGATGSANETAEGSNPSENFEYDPYGYDSFSGGTTEDGKPGLALGDGGPTGAKPGGKNLQNGPVPKLGKLKPLVKPATAPAATAHAGTAAAVLAGAQAVYHLLNALSSATSLTVSPAVFFLPLMMLSGDTPNRLAQRGKFKGGKQSARDQDFGLPSDLFDWWHNGGGKAGNMGKDIGREPGNISPKEVLEQWNGLGRPRGSKTRKRW